MATIVQPEQFRVALRRALLDRGVERGSVVAVTGPGRSGAVASVYASHMLGAPFVPYGQPAPAGTVLVVDTAAKTGRTLRRAERRYPGSVAVAVFNEPPRVTFWYEHQGSEGGAA